MISEPKSSMDLMTDFDLQLEQLPNLLTCSQGTTVSDSWYIDNNPLMAACEQNADFSWKYNTSEVAQLESLLQSESNDANSSNRSDTEICIDDIPTQDLAFLSTVVMSPVSNPPTSPSCKHETNDAAASKTMACEADVLINEIFKPTEEENARMKIEEIQNWLLIASSSQGNEYLSQSQEQREMDDIPVAEVVVEDDLPSEVVGFCDMESSVSMAASMDATVCTNDDLSDQEIRSVKSSKKRKKASKITKDRREGKVEKKRNQNKEAARRYRDKKKVEAEVFFHQRQELEEVSSKRLNELRDKLKEREILLNLWKQCVSSKTNPNFTVHFPSWMS